MISHILIKNFAIIENAEFSLYPGFNVLTGETGSGKSIVIEAISLALGSRADSSMVRTGQDKAIIQIVGHIDQEEMIIKREISASGKSLCKLNGEIVTLGELSLRCKQLADIHGQYDHQSLINNDYHLSLIDSYNYRKLDPLKEKVASLHRKYLSLKKELSAIRLADAERIRKRDFLKFECDEILNADPINGEDEQLSEQISIMQNSEKIYNSLSELYETSSESDSSVMDALGYLMRKSETISDMGSKFKALSDEFSDIYYRFEDLCHDMREMKDNSIFSPNELDEALSRMDLLSTLKRKYGGSITDILQYKENALQELSDIENIDVHTADLEKDLNMVTTELSLLSEQLSALRKNAAIELCSKIENELKELSFNNAELGVEFGRISEEFSEKGIDTACFIISTNIGEPKKHLSKIASGGEMSRIMLAFKKITADYDNISTLIFDEIDAGISGIAASIVGRKLKEISKNHQIICITHLPQIAAYGDKNYKILKEAHAGSTRTYIAPLDEQEKINEIARLLGGASVTETILKSASELVLTSV
ncbi:MAG: DNA repair protein RecN [Eubacteriales bacterium]|nr:DNA repair protein RecN [Eubacteriales bacterium]MDD4389616.1 DNA repair protein RecN [Eubacteriales bacterium]